RTSCAYCSTPLLPPGPTLFPYTTLFRSRCFNSHGIHVGRLGRQDGGRTYTVAASGRVFETFVPAWRTLTTASRVLRRDRGSQGAAGASRATPPSRPSLYRLLPECLRTCR